MMWLGEFGIPAERQTEGVDVEFMIKGVDSVGSCATLDQCRESERVPPVAALALKSTSRIG